MKIEVIVGESEPEIYVLKNSRLSIGKDSSCDITVADAEISRNHLEILKESGKVYVVDAGSLNGTYLNEERLSPGQKMEFLSFFPLRLGTNVLISLLDEAVEVDEEYQSKKIPSHSETTRVVSLKDLKAANTKKLLKKSRNKAAPKPKQKKRFKLSFANVVACLILIAGAAYNLTKQSDSQLVTVPEVGTKTSATESVKFAIPVLELQSLLSVEKCKNELESFLCKSVATSFVPPWGAKINGDTAYLQLVGKKYYDEAKSLLNQKSTAPVSEIDIWKVASALFLMEGIKSDFNSSSLKEKKMLIAFYSDEEVPKLTAVISILPEALENVKVLLVKRRLEALAVQGTSVIKFTEDYYSVMTPEGT